MILESKPLHKKKKRLAKKTKDQGSDGSPQVTPPANRGGRTALRCCCYTRTTPHLFVFPPGRCLSLVMAACPALLLFSVSQVGQGWSIPG